MLTLNVSLMHWTLSRPVLVLRPGAQDTWIEACCAFREEDHLLGSGIENLDTAHSVIIDSVALAVCAVNRVMLEHSRRTSSSSVVICGM